MTVDPRPLTTEPLALDLVDTVWVDDRGPHDLFERREALSAWLHGHGFHDSPTDDAARRALLTARSAIRAVVDAPQDADALRSLDDILAHGHLHLRAGSAGADERLEVDHERWRAPWSAVRDLLRLRGEAPGRIRACANPDCVLVFYDTSRNGRRQWCSMAGCGNRAKARRHYQRSRGNA